MALSCFKSCVRNPRSSVPGIDEIYQPALQRISRVTDVAPDDSKFKRRKSSVVIAQPPTPPKPSKYQKNITKEIEKLKALNTKRDIEIETLKNKIEFFKQKISDKSEISSENSYLESNLGNSSIKSKIVITIILIHFFFDKTTFLPKIPWIYKLLYVVITSSHVFLSIGTIFIKHTHFDISQDFQNFSLLLGTVFGTIALFMLKMAREKILLKTFQAVTTLISLFLQLWISEISPYFAIVLDLVHEAVLTIHIINLCLSLF